jgi:hypothetical protein
MNRRQFLLATPLAALAQDELLRKIWTARWIAVPGAPLHEYGVYHFRRAFDLAAKPSKFLIHASGDNRYQLFVNGKRVAWGPARGDLFHWRYETVDLAPYLEAGRNVLAAVVWNFGEDAPEAQITLQTGFLLQGATETERVADTGPSWKCVRNEAYSPIPITSGTVRGYYVAGPGDRVDAAKYPWGWETREFDDSGWRAAEAVSPAAGREAQDVHSRWMLVPRTIPAMEERGDDLALHGEFPARSKQTLLLDNKVLTTAYPELMVSGGAGAVVKISYAESLFEPPKPGQRGLVKGNRSETDGKQFIGYSDEFVADGRLRRSFRPLWWRTYRYIRIEMDIKDQPLTIESLTATSVSYPFERRATFQSDAPELNRILDVGWRTARLCAHETYMDCPYYEQLQYVGDTRVQCLVSLFNSGDARLMKNAIELIDNSRQSEGATMSRYPTRLEQFIPDFSLWWIGMVRDYWWYVDDPAFVRRMLPGVRAVLSFFERYQQENGSLKTLPWWRYFDWVPSWANGNVPQDADGGSALFDMHLILAYGWAADLETGPLSAVYRERERKLRATAQTLYWDPARRLYGDTPSKKSFSQHTQTMAVLADVVTGAPARELMTRMLGEKDLAQPGLFFQFYVHQALAKVGEGDTYLDRLGPWRDMLAKNLTTFAETVDRPGGSSRSDCHAWSASPNIEIFRTVLGVDSAAPEFARVSVRPHLGKLKFASGSVPHPKGSIDVRIEGSTATIVLPAGVTGEFEYRGVKKELRPGRNSIAI